MSTFDFLNLFHLFSTDSERSTMKSVHSRRLPAFDPWNNTGRSCTIREIRDHHWPQPLRVKVMESCSKFGCSRFQRRFQNQVPKKKSEVLKVCPKSKHQLPKCKRFEAGVIQKTAPKDKASKLQVFFKLLKGNSQRQHFPQSYSVFLKFQLGSQGQLVAGCQAQSGCARILNISKQHKVLHHSCITESLSMPTLMHFVRRHGHDGDHMAAHYVHFPFLFKGCPPAATPKYQ